MSTDDLLALARSVVDRAESGEEVEAYVVRSHDTDVEIFDGEVESLSVAGIEGVGVRIVKEKRQGFSWAGSHHDSVVADLVSEARDNASFGEVDEWYGLVSTDDVAGDVAALDLWDDALLAVSTDEKVQLALELEASTRRADHRIRGVESAGYGDRASEIAIASSNGIVATTRRTSCSAHAFAMAGNGDETQTGTGISAGRSIADLDLDRVIVDAVERSTRMLGAQQPPSRRLPVVLDPSVTRSFLGLLSAAFNGESLLKGRSLFEGRLGETIAAEGISIVEDATDSRAFGAAEIDSEGVPTRRVAIVTGGELQGFLHNRYTGVRSGDGTTGSASRGFKSTPGVGIRALRLEPGALDADAILAAAGDALYVQSVSGLHSGTNPVSGAFSVGAEGLMIRDGALAEPVREMTIASTLQRMLLDIVEVGSDLEFLPGAVAGQTVLVSEMTMSGS